MRLLDPYSCTRCSVAIPAAARVSNRSLHHPFPQLLFEYAASDAVAAVARGVGFLVRSEEHTSELQSLMRISYAVFCLKKKITHKITQPIVVSESSNNTLSTTWSTTH